MQYTNYFSSQVNQNRLEPIDLIKSRKPYIVNLIKSHFPKDLEIEILDVACGYGAFLYFLKSLGYINITGVEISEEQITVAKRLGVDNIQKTDIIDFLKNTPDKKYDILIAFDIFEHLTKSDLLRAMNECNRVLKNKGKLIMHVPNGSGIFSGVVFYGDLTHQTCFTAKSLKQLFKNSNFSNVDFFEDHPVPHGVKSLVRFLLWRIIRTIFSFIYLIETGTTEDLILSQNILAIAKKH